MIFIDTNISSEFFRLGFTFLNGLKDPWHMPVSKLNVLQTLCYLLSTFLNYLDRNGGFGEDDQRTVSAPTSKLLGRSLANDRHMNRLVFTIQL
jgi:hypothetical protein